MKLQKRTPLILTTLLSFILFLSCESSDDSDNNQEPTPTLLENYFFRGTLDGADMNIEYTVYDFTTEPSTTLIDFGPSQTSDIIAPGSNFCYSVLACGILPAATISGDDLMDTAKMYFNWIPVGECTFENERNALNDFLALPNFEYNVYSNPFVLMPNTVALDFFSKDFPNLDVYFSSRFGDNTDATFQITAVEEIQSGVFVIEGNFSCKLYKQNDPTEFKNLENATFKIKILQRLSQ